MLCVIVFFLLKLQAEIDFLLEYANFYLTPNNNCQPYRFINPVWVLSFEILNPNKHEAQDPTFFYLFT